MSTTISYNGKIIATLAEGEQATLEVKNKLMISNIVITANYADGSGSGGGSTETTQYLHTIIFEEDGGGYHIMRLINNSSVSLSGDYEAEDTDIYAGAIISGYSSPVAMHCSNGGGGNCYLELEDGTTVNSYYGQYTDTVTEYDGSTVYITGAEDYSYTNIPEGITWYELLTNETYNPYNDGSRLWLDGDDEYGPVLSGSYCGLYEYCDDDGNFYKQVYASDVVMLGHTYWTDGN